MASVIRRKKVECMSCEMKFKVSLWPGEELKDYSFGGNVMGSCAIVSKGKERYIKCPKCGSKYTMKHKYRRRK